MSNLTKKKNKPLGRECFKIIRTVALAQKHGCSDVYIRLVLSGKRASNSLLAQMILKDVHDMMAIYTQDTAQLIDNEGK